MNKNSKFILSILIPIVFVIFVLTGVFYPWTAFKNAQYANNTKDASVIVAYNFLKTRYPKVNNAYKISEIKKAQSENMQLITLSGQGLDAKFLVHQASVCYIGFGTQSQEVFITNSPDCGMRMEESCSGDIKCTLATYGTNLTFFLRRIGKDNYNYNLKQEYADKIKNSKVSTEEIQVEAIDFWLESLGETGGMMSAGFKVFLHDQKPLSIDFLGGMIS